MSATHTATRPALNALDFLELDALLSDEERMIRDTVRRSCASGCCPTWRSGSRRGVLPRELAPELGGWA